MKGLLNRAVESKEKLEMIYMSDKGDISQRVIKVLVVNELSIKAYCYNKKQFRIFKLSNILSVGSIRQSRGA